MFLVGIHKDEGVLRVYFFMDVSVGSIAQSLVWDIDCMGGITLVSQRYGAFQSLVPAVIRDIHVNMQTMPL